MPNREIRPVTHEEMPGAAFNAARQLGMSPEMFTGMPPEWTLCAFVDGELATTYGAWPLTIRFNGNAVPMAGVTWVSTHPAYRRKGNLRAITSRHFALLHEEGRFAMAGLHPAWVAIYQRYGYGLITTRRSYRVDPKDIRFAHPLGSPGRLREVELETEFASLVDLYRRYREDRTGLIHRGRAMWDAGPLAPPERGHQRTVLAYEEEGTVLGYVIFTTGPGPAAGRAVPPQVLVVQDLFALSPAAHQALWTCIAGYDNVREVTWNNAPPDDPLFLMVEEPRLLNTSVRDGIMVRLVTVDAALAQRPYSAHADLRFELRDEVCPWNEGRWRLQTAPEGGEARRAEGSPVDVVLTPDVLAMLVWGTCSASAAAQAGLLEVRDDSALPRWDAALRTKHPPHEAEHTW